MSENNIEPEALPSTSQSGDVQKTAIFPLVSLPKIVLTRLDLENLPVPVYTSPSPVNKPVKSLKLKKNKPVVPKTLPKKTFADVKHDTRTRGRPKKDYKVLSEIGKSPIELTTSKIPTGKVGGIVKKVPKLTVNKEEDNTVKGMLKKTMLQKRSKIAIPPSKKFKFMPKKPAKTNTLPPKPKKEKTNAVASTPKKEVSPKIKEITFNMDTDASEDEFLYDELIDELVNPPNKKVSAPEKTTNITLKPNVGNKPPTIVKGGIVKKSSLPPDLKSVASPTTLNSSKLTGTALNSKSKTAAVENVIKAPATAETPKACLPIKASPFPIAINSSPSKTGPKDQGKRGQKRSAMTISAENEDPPLNINTPSSSSTQIQISKKPKSEVKSPASVSRPRGRPKLGPKQAIKPSPILNTAVDDESDRPRGRPKLGPKQAIKPSPILNTAVDDESDRPRGRPKLGPKQAIKPSPILNTAVDDESDEYTEVETLENIESEPLERSKLANDSTKNEDIQVVTLTNSNGITESDLDRSTITSKKDEDPHLDLLRILTDDTEDAQSEPCELKEIDSGNPHNNPEENPKPNLIATADAPNISDTPSSDKSNDPDTNDQGSQKQQNTSDPQSEEILTVQNDDGISDNANDVRELSSETVVESTPHVRTIYDLISDVSLQYPSWNLHIIPETSAFCIAQVTKGRLGLPTLKKCIELDADTYSAKVYIHQYHIKRFDGVYDSEEAILALIEEIHSIKA